MKRLHALGASIFFFPFAAFAATATDTSGSNMAFGLFKVIIALAVVLAIMAGFAWLLKRFGVAKVQGSRTIKIVGGVSVGNRERVLVVEVADQWIVVGVAPGHVAALATMPRQESAAPHETLPAANNFAAWLKQTMDKRNAK